MNAMFELASSRGPWAVAPQKILALGLNYHDHIKESVSIQVSGMDATEPPEPVLFPKSPSSLVAHGAPIVLPRILAEYQFPDERTDYEGELAVIIGKTGSWIPEGDAQEYILGYTCANDVSQRNIQTGDRAGWFRGKSFDTFTPLGPRLVYADEIADPHALTLVTRLNGTVVQEGSTAAMINNIYRSVAWISRSFTLYPGDIILTGTPAGVGPIAHGDRVEVEISGIGVLENPVIDSRRGDA
jgi:2-keto-4-pentenoate hydratase/2-oxohepta-3-ene-1,7-dioic acid hydratase in catechol pathway